MRTAVCVTSVQWIMGIAVQSELQSNSLCGVKVNVMEE